jgi:SAM-dependent methyltransferase
VEIRDFYERIGWKHQDGIFEDAKLNENLSSFAQRYVSGVRMRVSDNLPKKGDLFLDIGSGPIQYKEYEILSKYFKERHCVDLSATALEQASIKLGTVHVKSYNVDFFDFESGLKFDAICAINCLYHVNIERQIDFVRKMLTHLTGNGVALIVYSNPMAPSAIITRLLLKVRRKFQFWTTNRSSENPIYFERHKRRIWRSLAKEFQVEIIPWRTLNPILELRLLPKNRFGSIFLEILFWLESKQFWLPFSEYYIVRITHRVK